jgi:hypothetical protein
MNSMFYYVVFDAFHVVFCYVQLSALQHLTSLFFSSSSVGMGDNSVQEKPTVLVTGRA